MKLKLIFTTLVSTFFLFSVSPSHAKAINLYDQPKADAKTVGQIDLSNGYIPIFSPKNSGWVKIGDPRNGNVGWVKTTDITASANSSGVNFSQQIISHDGGKHYFYIKNGIPQQMSDQEAKIMLKKMEDQQRAAQMNMQRAMQQLMKDMDNLYHPLSGQSFPMIMPVIVIPQQVPSTPLKNPAAPVPHTPPVSPTPKTPTNGTAP